jgi:hypothetical protein
MGAHIPLRLPDGHLLSPRWRFYSRFCTAAIVLGTVLFNEPGRWAKPLEPLLILYPLSFVGAIASMAIRYRRSRGEARQQIRWIAFGGAIFVSSYALVWSLIITGFSEEDLLFNLVINLVALTYAAIPVAIGFSVLKYRLYDIDLIISRTLVYAALTAILAGTYVVIVTVAGTIVGGSEIVTAGATLSVAALFQPLRRRIQSFIDRRFYRSRYNAAQTVELFSTRLRDEVDLEAMRVHLLTAVQETMQPRRVSVWLRAKAPG